MYDMDIDIDGFCDILELCVEDGLVDNWEVKILFMILCWKKLNVFFWKIM